MAEMQKVLTGQSMCTTDMGTCDGFQSSGDECAYTRASQESVGSMFHSEGACKPCAWFWKPQGCRNGKDCLHCHLCPCSEIRARKKKQSSRQKKDPAIKSAESPGACSLSPHYPSLPLFLPPPGLTPTSDDEKPFAFSDSFTSLYLEPAALAETPSKGSELHQKGDCRPCAWFWHPKSCDNGSNCSFCHICPPGEIKARRKQKILKLRQESTQDSQDSMEEAMEDLLPGSLFGEEEEEGTQKAGCTTQPHQAATAKLEADLQSLSIMDQSPAKVICAESWPSLGSEKHGTGECRPCAWFWKKGCRNGKECLHCHLCPEGEIRRKKKEAAAAKVRSIPQSDTRNMEEAVTMQQRIIQQQQQRLVDLQLQLQFQQRLMVASAAMTSSTGTFASNASSLMP